MNIRITSTIYGCVYKLSAINVFAKLGKQSQQGDPNLMPLPICALLGMGL